MMNMKRPIYWLSLMLVMLVAAAAHAVGNNALVVHLKNGASTTVLLDKLPRATFSGDKLMVVGEGLELAFERDDVQRFTYTYADPSVITSPTEKHDVRFTSDIAYVAGLHLGDKVGVYGTDGRMVNMRSVGADGRAVLPIGHLPKGIYVLQINGSSYKFHKP